MEETTYKIEFDFDTYKSAELLIESFMIIGSIFTKCLKTSFTVSFPSIADNSGITNCIEIELRTNRPLIHEEYKNLSIALYKISWSCFIRDLETNIKTIIRKEIFNIEQELLFGEFI